MGLDLKEWNNAICSNMDGPRDCHAEWNKSHREREISHNITYMWNLKGNDTNELTKQKQTNRLREWTYGCWEEGWGKRQGVWEGHEHTAVFKMDKQQGPTV